LTEADGAESVFGGKSANLARLARSGFRVAPGFCISIAAYEEFLRMNDLGPVIQMELGRKPLDQMRWEEIWDAALRIRNRFLSSTMSDEFAQTVSRWVIESAGDKPLAVRSSAPGEDSSERSFAGLHESFLNVVGPTAVCQAVRLVWASLWSDAALLYRKELSLDPLRSRMAVLVQVMQKEDCSGVAFGCDPRNGDLDRAIIEAVPGVCADLVDGNTDPDRWVFARSTRQLIENRCGDRPRNREEELLTGTDLEAILDLLDGVEQRMKWSPDMEWTGHHDRLTVLQARPVTQPLAGQANGNDQRPWYLTLRPGRQKLQVICDRVAGELIPELARVGEELAAEDLDRLDDPGLADCLDERKDFVDRWKKIYWNEFIPMAHGVRYLGLYYNDAVRPNDPYEFVDLLRGEDMLAAQRNRSMRELARSIGENPHLRDVLEEALSSTDTASSLDQFLSAGLQAVPGGDACMEAIGDLRNRYLDMAFNGVRLADHPGSLLRTVLELSSAMGPDPTQETTSAVSSPEVLESRLLSAVGPEREDEAREVLRLGRLSWRLRDDDNILVARLDGQFLRALKLSIERLKAAGRLESQAKCCPEYLSEVCTALRDVSKGPVALPEMEERPGFEVSRDLAEKPRQLIGQPAAIGIARGPVRIIQSASDLESFRAGEVLVCDAIQPMMTHLVPLACAVVERRGGMLIHGAIIARELGIPCVNGVAKLTEILADGQIITVDGHLGIVTVGEPEFDLELCG
jgi:pyruvate,water dikinase